jgi:hypothetical protein
MSEETILAVLNLQHFCKRISLNGCNLWKMPCSSCHFGDIYALEKIVGNLSGRYA